MIEMELDLQEYFKKAVEGKIELSGKKLLVGLKVRTNVGSIHFRPTTIIEANICEDFIILNLKEPSYLEVYMAISLNSNFNGIGKEKTGKYCIFYNKQEERVLQSEGVTIILP